APSVLHRREQFFVGLAQPRQQLGVLLVSLVVALRDQLHPSRICHRYLVAEFLEQLAHPTRVCSHLDDHVRSRASEELAERLPRRLHRLWPLQLPVREQNAQLALVVAQVASDRLDGRLRHGRSLLALRVRYPTGTLAGRRERPPPEPTTLAIS